MPLSKNRLRLLSATTLYRWNLTVSIIGPIVSALTFVGVMTIILQLTLFRFGIPFWVTPFILLFGLILVYMSVGYTLDRHARFWVGQSVVGMARNQYSMAQFAALRLLLESAPDSTDKRKILRQFERLEAEANAEYQDEFVSEKTS